MSTATTIAILSALGLFDGPDGTLRLVREGARDLQPHGRSFSRESSSRPRFPQENHSHAAEKRVRGKKHSRKTR